MNTQDLGLHDQLFILERVDQILDFLSQYDEDNCPMEFNELFAYLDDKKIEIKKSMRMEFGNIFDKIVEDNFYEL